MKKLNLFSCQNISKYSILIIGIIIIILTILYTFGKIDTIYWGDNVKFIVGCDADGVLTNLSEHNLREGKKTFKRDIINDDAYSLEEMFDLKGISKLVLYSKAFKIYLNYCKNEPPRENVTEVFNELIDKDFEFNSITARKFATTKGPLGQKARSMFKNWLNKYNIKFNSFQFCDEVRSPEDKLLACKKLNVDAMIEDKSDVALNLANNGVKVILIDAPYNKDINHENIVRVSNWSEVKDTLLEMKKEKDKKEVNEFVKQDKEVLEKYSDEEKINYFNSYKKYLKNLTVDYDAFKKGDRKFKIIYSMLKYPVKAFYRIKAFGKEKIPYQNGFIIAANHTDSTDQYRLGLVLGNRPFVGFAAKEIEDSFRGSLFKSTGLGIFVDRKDPESRKESSSLMANYIAHDRISLIFPEGTRKNKDEEGRNRFQNRFKLGTVALAQKTGTGILPVAINAFGKDTVIRFGDFIYVSPTDDLEEVNKNLELLIADMSLENIKYYLEKKNRSSEIEQVVTKYNEYVEEVKGIENNKHM